MCNLTAFAHVRSATHTSISLSKSVLYVLVKFIEFVSNAQNFSLRGKDISKRLSRIHVHECNITRVKEHEQKFICVKCASVVF